MPDRRSATSTLCAVFAVFVLLGMPNLHAADTGGGHPQWASMVLDDCFATPPPAPTTPLDGWTSYGGVWTVDNGTVHGQGDGGSKLIFDRPLPADFELAAEVLMADGIQWTGLIICVNEPAEGADNLFAYEAGVDPREKIIRFGAHRNDYELIRDQPWPLEMGRWSELRMRRTGSRVEVLVDGRLAISHDDGSRALPAGKIGLRVWQGDLHCRNVRVVVDGKEQSVPVESTASLAPARVATSAAWNPISEGMAELGYEEGGPYGPGKVQRLTLRQEPGRVAIASAGPRGTGIALVADRPYRAVVWARADQPAVLAATLETPQGQPLAETQLAVQPGDWQRLPCTLTPKADEAQGRLVLGLRRPGEVRLARVSLEPEAWAWPDTLSIDGLPPIVYLARPMLGGPPAVGCDLWAARPTQPGCAIRMWEPARPEGPPRTVFESAEGCIYDMNLSLDARTVFFSYAGPGETHWHLWRIGIDGSGLRQITHGPFYDVSPCELPDGDLVFVSTRRFGHTVCQPGPASNLHRVSAEGGEPRCLSMNTLSDTTPQLLPDGRVLFMRWEYVDRDLTFRQSLWTQNPDGSGYQLFFGNTMRDPGTFWQARPIPGSDDRVLATFGPHHGYPHGAIGWIRRGHGPEAPRGVGFDWITKEFSTIGDHSILWSYRDPFPLDENRFLCAYGGGINRFRILLHDGNDRRRTLVEEPAWHCFFPMALRPVPRPPVVAGRAPAVRPGEPDLPEEYARDAQPMGVCFLADVYRGLEPTIERGRVKSIRIMEQVRKTEDIPVTPHVVDFGPRAYDQSPTMSYATYYAKRCWGSVLVEDDGSACFQVPALREIYFQACDAEGRELQRMTSAVQLMPGEVASCVGCHEPRLTSPPVLERSPQALRRKPSVPEKPPWAPDGIIDFVGTVQPVLDRHCVKCHQGADPAGGYDLSGDKTRLFNMAYDNLLGRSRSYRQHKMDTGEMLPEEAAKGKPLVHFFWLLKTPTAVNQPLWAGSHASRLTEILESDHAGQPIPLEDRQRVYLWIDANVPYYGTFATSRPKCCGKRDLLGDPATGEPEAWYTRDFLPVYARRCTSCHGDLPPTKLVTCWDGRTAWINFTHPEWSAALTAHLPKTAGGRGIDRAADGAPIPQFAGTDDPDYQTMLRAVREGKKRSEAAPGPDMAGYTGRVREP